MQSQNRLLDDLARVASGALGVAAGVRGEAEARLREQFERIVQQMDLVRREDHEVVFAMAQEAREAQEALAERLAAIEARLERLEQAQTKPAATRGSQTARGVGQSGRGTAKKGGKTGGKGTGAEKDDSGDGES